MVSIELPAYIDPAVLVPGAAVYALLGGKRERLIVERVEPSLICRAPDGTGVVVFAHTVVPAEDNDAPTAGERFRDLQP